MFFCLCERNIETNETEAQQQQQPQASSMPQQPQQAPHPSIAPQSQSVMSQQTQQPVLSQQMQQPMQTPHSVAMSTQQTQHTPPQQQSQQPPPQMHQRPHYQQQPIQQFISSPPNVTVVPVISTQSISMPLHVSNEYQQSTNYIGSGTTTTTTFSATSPQISQLQHLQQIPQPHTQSQFQTNLNIHATVSPISYSTTTSTIGEVAQQAETIRNAQVLPTSAIDAISTVVAQQTMSSIHTQPSSLSIQAQQPNHIGTMLPNNAGTETDAIHFQVDNASNSYNIVSSSS